jgi:hypothetical protein
MEINYTYAVSNSQLLYLFFVAKDRIFIDRDPATVIVFGIYANLTKFAINLVFDGSLDTRLAVKLHMAPILELLGPSHLFERYLSVPTLLSVGF